MSSIRRAFIIGLDGATFELLDPMMDSGIMPNLKRIRDKAASGILRSTVPPTTPPAWTTCTTGVNPGRHGIYDFTVSPLKNPSRPLVSTRDIRALRLWKAVEQSGGRSIVVNVPITYPPEELSGCMVSGMMTPGFDSPFTHPPEVKDRIKAVCGNYILNVDIPKYDTASETEAIRFFDDLRESLERRLEAVRYLMDSEFWTFFMVVFIAPDRIQHLFAKYLFPGNSLYDSAPAKRLRPRIMEIYRRLDEIIGELTEKLTENDTLFILSDHGFGMTDGFFNANTWLLTQGLLAVNTGHYTRKRIFNMLQLLGDNPLIRTMLPEKLQSGIRRAIRRTRSSFLSPKNDLAQTVDWANTRVFFSSIPCQGFYINERTGENPRGTVDREDVENIMNLLKKRLLELQHPRTGELLTDQVWFREELFQGNETRFAPHVLFCMRNYAVLGRQHLGASGFFTDASSHPVGFHRPDGILMMAGPAVAPGTLNADMADIMPTVLCSMSLPIPENLDGSPLYENFQPEFRSPSGVLAPTLTLIQTHAKIQNPSGGYRETGSGTTTS